VNRILGNFRSGAARVALVACVATATVAALALPASANTGTVHTAQDCYTWSASVSLNPDVHSDHFVEVTTTIPGTTGIVDGHYNTIGNNGPIQIWHVTGEAPSSGTVTLTILNSDRSVDSTATAKLPPSEVCPTTSTTTTPPPVTVTTAVETTTTVAPTTTITVSPTSITLPPTTPPTAPPSTPTTPTTPSTPSAPTTPTSTHQQVIPGSSTTTTTIVPGGKSQSLPFTGSGTAFPAIFGLSCLAGGTVLAVRRRGRWAIRK
jgi:LPXTG-motif cell wall-anchored protein